MKYIVVFEDGTMIALDKCVIVELDDPAGEALLESYSDSERYTFAKDLKNIQRAFQRALSRGDLDDDGVEIGPEKVVTAFFRVRAADDTDLAKVTPKVFELFLRESLDNIPEGLDSNMYSILDVEVME